MKNNKFSSSLYQRVFFCQFFDGEVLGLTPKYYLLDGDTRQVSIFFLTQDYHLHRLLKFSSSLSTLPVWGYRKYHTLVAFKTNKKAVLSNECLSTLCSLPNLREKEGLFGIDRHIFIL